jgi:hypothetical protein
MAFTVAVESKSPDEQCTADDIKLFHQECGGGEITRSEEEIRGGVENKPTGAAYWQLHCKRCHTNALVRASNNGTALLMKTATDGESREIQQYVKDFIREDKIYAIPRT